MVIKVIECIDFNVTLNNEVMLSVTTHAIAHTHVHKLTRAHTNTHCTYMCVLQHHVLKSLTQKCIIGPKMPQRTTEKKRIVPTMFTRRNSPNWFEVEIERM